MASAGSLIFELAADVAHLRADMKKANDVITSSLNSVKKAAGAIGLTIGAAMAANLARSFASSIQGAIDQGDALGKLAERIGTTSEALSGLQYAASLNNVSSDELTTSFRNLNKALIDAENPASTAAQAIRAIGLNVADLKSKDPSQAFKDIAQAISGFENGADKGAVVSALFGRNMQSLIPLLNQGADGIAQATKEAEDFGVVISGNVTRAMSDFNDQMTRIKTISEGVRNQLAIALLPALEVLVSEFLNGIREGKGLSSVFAFIAEQAILTAADIMSLTGRLKIQIEVFKDWARAAKALGTLNFKDFAQYASDIVEKPKQGIAELDASIEQMKNNARTRYDELISGLSRVEAASDNASKGTLNFNDAVQKTGKSAKAAKQGIDEYTRFLQTMQEELRKAQNNGNEWLDLFTDSRFLSATNDQQAALIQLKERIIETNEANAEFAREQERAAEAVRLADQAHIERIENLRALADTTLDALDPTREYQRTMEQLVEATKAGFLSTEQLAQAQAYYTQKLQETLDKADPYKQQLESLKDAMLGFGKSATDSLVDFVSGADNASKSFGEMTASILRDIAKMLVYKNFIEPLFKGIGGGGWSGFLGLSATSAGAAAALGYSGQRMAGGPVLPGRLYRVNESPLASEFFRPSVAGNVVRDNGGDKAMNVYITVNTSTGEVDSAGDTSDAIELAKRMAMIARQVITTEKRTGGLLAGS
ncbi:hypothetical protein [Paraburkholderia bannensis]|uniref:hypothetical protein n=1 Tax=Paraburkholderia bannensis TaxID=765414 RepID=UPI002AC3260F|nr:hypothetical protein [Paraburkholderia bannensis]